VDVVIDPPAVLVVVLETGGLAGWVVDEGPDVATVGRSATAVESAEPLVVVVVVAESDGDPHAAIISKRTVKAQNHLEGGVERSGFVVARLEQGLALVFRGYHYPFQVSGVKGGGA
jgi:hypothetical protein